MKKAFLREKQNAKMCEDLRSLLLNLPIPILVLDNSSVHLSNNETKKLLSLQEDCSNDDLQDHIS